MGCRCSRKMRILEWSALPSSSCDPSSAPTSGSCDSSDPLARWVYEARLSAECIRVCGDAAPMIAMDWSWFNSLASVQTANEVLRSYSGDAAAVFLLLPPPPSNESVMPHQYAELLHSLCAGLPLTVFCGEGTGQPVIATEI